MPNLVHIKSLLPMFQRLWIPFLNLIGQKNEYRIVITTENYIEIRIMFGFVTFEKGQKSEFVIRGTDAYINAVISSINKRGLQSKLKI